MQIFLKKGLILQNCISSNFFLTQPTNIFTRMCPSYPWHFATLSCTREDVTIGSIVPSFEKIKNQRAIICAELIILFCKVIVQNIEHFSTNPKTNMKSQKSVKNITITNLSLNISKTSYSKQKDLCTNPNPIYVPS